MQEEVRNDKQRANDRQAWVGKSEGVGVARFPGPSGPPHTQDTGRREEQRGGRESFIEGSPMSGWTQTQQ